MDSQLLFNPSPCRDFCKLLGTKQKNIFPLSSLVFSLIPSKIELALVGSTGSGVTTSSQSLGHTEFHKAGNLCIRNLELNTSIMYPYGTFAPLCIFRSSISPVFFFFPRVNMSKQHAGMPSRQIWRGDWSGQV